LRGFNVNLFQTVVIRKFVLTVQYNIECEKYYI